MESVRIFVKKKDPNPLFKKWLKELIDEAKEKNKRKIVETYQTALKSLEKYPLVLYTGSDAVILEGFGPKICQILNEKLEQHLKTCDNIDQNLGFKDQVEFLRKNDKKQLEEFLNKVESDFNAEDYEKSESDNENEENGVGEIQENGKDEVEQPDQEDLNDSFDFSPPRRFSITVVDQNLTIQDILNADEPLLVNNSSDSDDEEIVTQKSKVLGKRKISDTDEPPKKVPKPSASVENVNKIESESEDEFDKLVKKCDKKFESQTVKSKFSEKELEVKKTPNFPFLGSAKSGSLKRFKTFGGTLENGKTRNFSTPISRKIDYSAFSPISEGHERSHLDFVDLAGSPEPLVFEDAKMSEKSPVIVDLSQSPEPEDIEMELQQQKPPVNEKFKTPVSSNPSKLRRSKTFGASLKESPVKLLEVPRMEDSIDRIIAGYGFSPISKISPVKVREKSAGPVIDLSLSPDPTENDEVFSKKSPQTKSSAASTKLRRSNTFGGKLDDSLEPVSSVLYSKPVVASPHFGEDDIDRIMAKYSTPEVVKPKKKIAEKLPEKSPKKSSPPKKAGKPAKLVQTKLIPQSGASLKRTKSVPAMGTPSSSAASTDFSTQIQKTISLNRVASQVIQEEEDDEITYISVDDLNPEEFDVILLVDTAETSGKQKSSSDDTVNGLKDNKIAFEIRKLNAGDFLWIARHKADRKREYVLPYIVERKRLDDFSSSIKDGRFHEQKFRLRRSGIENVVYLIESHPRSRQHATMGLPFTTLLQAATNTQIHNKFTVKFTESHQHTLLYLTVMTGFIDNIFKKKAPIKFKLLEFEKFNKSMVKQRKCNVRETFIKQLLALKGLSVNIAIEIANHFPTPRDLYTKYRDMSREDGEKMLSKLPLAGLKKSIPGNVSKAIYDLYTK